MTTSLCTNDDDNVTTPVITSPPFRKQRQNDFIWNIDRKIKTLLILKQLWMETDFWLRCWRIKRSYPNREWRNTADKFQHTVARATIQVSHWANWPTASLLTKVLVKSSPQWQSGRSTIALILLFLQSPIQRLVANCKILRGINATANRCYRKCAALTVFTYLQSVF